MDLSIQGYAVWNIEYRRTEDAGGGWPGTFLDVGSALQHLTTIGGEYDLDLASILIAGHSAGGHLALWLGTMSRQSHESPLYSGNLPAIKGIVSLAGITDLTTYYAPSGCGDNTVKLTGGTPDQVPRRYLTGSPISFLPLNIPQILINGVEDDIVSIEHITPYFQKAKAAGDDVSLVKVENAGHFEVITPGSVAWEEIVKAFDLLLTK